MSKLVRTFWVNLSLYFHDSHNQVILDIVCCDEAEVFFKVEPPSPHKSFLKSLRNLVDDREKGKNILSVQNSLFIESGRQHNLP